MRKFFPSFVLAFILAVSFLVPVHDVFAESFNLSALRTSIVPASAKIKQTSNYGYICPTVALAKLSFFNRLLASVGITRPLSTQNLAESTGCGEPGIVTEVIDSSWVCGTSPDETGCGKEDYSKTRKDTFGAKYAATYGITSCTDTHVYATGYYYGVVTGGERAGKGTITKSCTGPRALPPSITKVTYPPSVDVNGIGSFRGRWLVGTNLIEDFSVTESSQTMLVLWDASGTIWGNYSFNVPIAVALTKLVLNNKTNEFDYVPVLCTSITVAGKALDKNCQTNITVPWVLAGGRYRGTVDVTPKAPVPYYTYSVFVNGAITEK